MLPFRARLSIYPGQALCNKQIALFSYRKSYAPPLCVISLQYAFRTSPVMTMKLTIIRLQHFSAQDRLDLKKIWPAADLSALEKTLGEQQQLWAAKFNDRLLAAVQVKINGTQGELVELMVREVTRRRGVGSYLLAELLANNPAITQWWIADANVEERATMAAFMQHGGFIAQSGGWGRLTAAQANKPASRL